MLLLELREVWSSRIEPFFFIFKDVKQLEHLSQPQKNFKESAIKLLLLAKFEPKPDCTKPLVRLLSPATSHSFPGPRSWLLQVCNTSINLRVFRRSKSYSILFCSVKKFELNNRQWMLCKEFPACLFSPSQANTRQTVYHSYLKQTSYWQILKVIGDRCPVHVVFVYVVLEGAGSAQRNHVNQSYF